VLYTLGVILAIAGVAIWILGSLGRAIGPRPTETCVDRSLGQLSLGFLQAETQSRGESTVACSYW
jgi:flagellar biogenesis protein FliO